MTFETGARLASSLTYDKLNIGQGAKFKINKAISVFPTPYKSKGGSNTLDSTDESTQAALV